MPSILVNINTVCQCSVSCYVEGIGLLGMCISPIQKEVARKKQLNEPNALYRVNNLVADRLEYYMCMYTCMTWLDKVWIPMIF